MGAALALVGCVGSQSARYERKLSAVIRKDDKPSSQVSVAFGLDTRSDTSTAVAAAPEP